MTTPLDCRRAEELLSDHLEGTLDLRTRAELDAHLAACAECRELHAALGEVLEVLHKPPEMEPGPQLAERVAAGAWRLGRQRAEVAKARHIPVPVHAVAASVAIALSAGLFFMGAASPGTTPAREVPLSVRMTEARDSMIETRDRLVEDYHILRVLVGTVFEGRLDRVGQRVEDYRRLLERRNRPSAAPKKSDVPAEHPPRSASRQAPGVAERWSGRQVLNPEPPPPVEGGERGTDRAPRVVLANPCKGAC
jgi:hypothetical protein